MRILLPYCRDVPHGFYWDFLDGLTEAIHERGDEAVRFPMAKIGEHDAAEMAALARELERGCELFLDLCCWGYGLTRLGVQQPAAAPRPILDALGIRYVGMLFDHPYNQPLNRVCAGQLFATFPDRGHRQQAEFVFPGLALAGDAFVPPAARARNAHPAARDIDVLYFGNLYLDALHRPWRGGAHAGLYDAVAERVRDQPSRPLHLVLQEALQAQNARPSAQEVVDLLSTMEFHFRSRFRHDVVTALARSGLRLLVVGGGWEQVALPANVELRAPLAYGEMFRLAGRSRICIDASTYFNGANDRVFNYALNGAVCFTNAAGYLGKEDWLRCYSLRALDALARHTWRERLETIVAATSAPSSSPPRPPAP